MTTQPTDDDLHLAICLIRPKNSRTSPAKEGCRGRNPDALLSFIWSSSLASSGLPWSGRRRREIEGWWVSRGRRRLRCPERGGHARLPLHTSHREDSRGASFSESWPTSWFDRRPCPSGLSPALCLERGLHTCPYTSPRCHIPRLNKVGRASAAQLRSDEHTDPIAERPADEAIHPRLKPFSHHTNLRRMRPAMSQPPRPMDKA